METSLRRVRRRIKNLQWSDVGEALLFVVLCIFAIALVAAMVMFAVGVFIDARTPPVYETRAGVVTDRETYTQGNGKTGHYSVYYIVIAGNKYEVGADDYKRIDAGDYVRFKVRINGIFSHKIIVEVVE